MKTIKGNKLFLVRKQSGQSEAIRVLRGRKKIGMSTDELMSLLRDCAENGMLVTPEPCLSYSKAQR